MSSALFDKNFLQTIRVEISFSMETKIFQALSFQTIQELWFGLIKAEKTLKWSREKCWDGFHTCQGSPRAKGTESEGKQ